MKTESYPQIVNLSLYQKENENMNINLNRRSKKILRLETSFSSIPCKSKTYKRGPYRAYEPSLKSKAIQMMTEDGLDFRVVAKSLGVPSKNVKRWLKVGPYRKKGFANIFFYMK